MAKKDMKQSKASVKNCKNNNVKNANNNAVTDANSNKVSNKANEIGFDDGETHSFELDEDNGDSFELK